MYTRIFSARVNENKTTLETSVEWQVELSPLLELQIIQTHVASFLDLYCDYSEEQLGFTPELTKKAWLTKLTNWLTNMIKEELKEFKKGELFLATVNVEGSLAGFITCTPVKPRLDEKAGEKIIQQWRGNVEAGKKWQDSFRKDVYISLLAVKPIRSARTGEKIRIGLGRQLIESVEARFTEANAMTLDTRLIYEAGIAFYRELGFSTTGERTFGGTIPAYYTGMEKQLLRHRDLTDFERFIEAAINSDLVFIREYIAKNKRNPQVFNRLDEQGFTALMYMAMVECVEGIHLLVEAGAEVDFGITTEANCTALYIAAHDHIDVFHALLAHGANIEMANELGNTLLLIAAINNHFDAVKTLIEHHANIDATSETSGTTLMAAVFKGHTDIYLNLLAAGANPNIPSGLGETALELAALRNDCVAIDALLEAGAEVNSVSDAKNTPLIWAAVKGFDKACARLLSARADVNAISMLGNTPLIFAAREGHQKIVTQLLAVPGINLTVRNQKGLTAEDEAIANGHLEIARQIRAVYSFQDRLDVAKYEGDVPNDLCCPISSAIMNDPITVSSGITYDRKFLVKYLETSGNPRTIPCPMTKFPILIDELKNRTSVNVKKDIEEFITKIEKAVVPVVSASLSVAPLATLYAAQQPAPQSQKPEEVKSEGLGLK